jgi:uncharacterized protein (DUF433 family)
MDGDSRGSTIDGWYQRARTRGKTLHRRTTKFTVMSSGVTDDGDASDPRIVEEVHDEPHVAGRRLTVRFLRTAVEERGLSPREVADTYELDVADVHRALAYYYDHPREMREIEKRREVVVEEAAETATDPNVAGQGRNA